MWLKGHIQFSDYLLKKKFADAFTNWVLTPGDEVEFPQVEGQLVKRFAFLEVRKKSRSWRLTLDDELKQKAGDTQLTDKKVWIGHLEEGVLDDDLHTSSREPNKIPEKLTFNVVGSVFDATL